MSLKYSSRKLTFVISNQLLFTILFLLLLLCDIIVPFSNTWLMIYPNLVLGKEIYNHHNNNNDRIINHLVQHHDNSNTYNDDDDEEIIKERMKITSSNTIPDTTNTRTTATKRDPYLYGRNGNPNTSYPIFEYYAPSSNDNNQYYDTNMIRPEFLYDNNQNMNNNNYRMIVYYIHWCNTCKDFVVQYITLAKQIIQLLDNYNNNNNPSPLNDHNMINITFYSISCSPNYLLCKDQHITAYPRIRLYVPYDNDGIDIPSHHISALTPNYILNKIGINIHNNNNNNNDDDEIIDHYDNRKKNNNMNQNGRDNNIVTTLNIESQTEFNKTTTIIEIIISKYKQLIDYIMKKIFANNDNVNKTNDTSTSLNDNNILMIKNNQPNQLLLNESLYNDNDNNNINDITEYYYNIKRRTRNELMYDIYMSIDYTFRNNIFITNENKISIRKKRILYDWLLLLHNTIPYTYDTIHLLLNDVIQNYQYIMNDNTGQYMNALLNEYNELFINNNHNNNDWSISCSYPCGLWSLLHTITIGVVEYNNNTMANNLYNTEYITLLIRDYIYHFFPCDTCRQHFIQQYNECYFRRCYILVSDNNNAIIENEYHWKQLVLWLYNTHNSVNIRLYLKKVISHNNNNHNDNNNIVSKLYHILYPSKQLCPKCWKKEEMMNNTIMIHEIISSTNKTNNIDSITKVLSSLLPDMIDHEMMYQYLRYEYWVRDHKNNKHLFFDYDIDVLHEEETKLIIHNNNNNNNNVILHDDDVLNHHHESNNHPSNDIEEKQEERQEIEQQQQQQVVVDIMNVNKNEHEDGDGVNIGFETSDNGDTILMSNSDVDRHDETEL